jgi:ankyrin repeat protein
VTRHTPTRTLRQRPDLDQLRRQARELLQAFAAGDADAVAEVNAHYRGADAATFALHDAQLVLARAHGFDSWPKLKAYVDGVTAARLADAVRAGDVAQVRAMLAARPELVHMDMAGNNEHRALHYAVLARSPEIVRILMEHGADARKGIYPHRDATAALTIAADRGYDEIVTIIHDTEQRRREAGSRPGAPAADELCEAIQRGDEDRALAMLQADPALVHACQRDGWTPLHAAAGVLSERVVAWLLQHGADVNRRGPGDRTPLDLASQAGLPRAGGARAFATVAGMLRRHGAELTARAAVALGEADLLRARHAEGTLVNRVEPAGGLLTVAVTHDRPEILALLLSMGLDPDEAVRVEGLEEVEVSRGMPLWHCAAAGKHAMARMLMEHGADPNGGVYASGSPVFQAYGQRDAEMIELLGRHGGTADAMTAGHYRLTDRARRMLAGEVDGRVSAGTFAGRTLAEQLLWAAACGGDAEIVRMALERVDWPRDDPRWYRVLEQPLRLWNHGLNHWANPALDRGTYLTCFRLVLQRCDPSVRGRFGLTVLHDVAASRPHVTADERVAFATLLLDAGARLDLRDELLRSTPLGWACRWGRVELVKLLLQRGAELAEPDAEPWATPMAWARKKGHEAVLAVLRESGR